MPERTESQHSEASPEGAFYTLLSWSSNEQNDILDRWKRKGIWDERITKWEVGALEAEERAAVRLVYASFVESPYGPEFGRQCPTCTLTVTPHCDGCAACPGLPHAWWCHGGTCICGCPESRHHRKTFRGAKTWDGKPYTLAGRCRGRRCGCRRFDDVERQGAYLAWCDCTPEEAAARRALGVAILMDFAFGVGPFDGIDGIDHPEP
jgi:hypothetical protein